MLGLKRGKVKLSPYDQKWLEVFKKEKKILQKVLKDTIIDIQHVGSTAVPGIPAKPIIDIAVAISRVNRKKVEMYIKPLKKVGYVYRGEDRPRQHLFAKGSEKKRICYLHMVKFDSKDWKNYLLFRNYLRTHKKIAEEYAKLKLSLARKFPNNRTLYTDGKDKFIQKILKRAKSDNKL
jgi:GrpB-like predicted nucleotidyltransferase (UPF0157 family)